MRCDDVAEQFLERNGEAHAELDQHVAGCQRCAHVARGMLRLDAVLATTLVVMPPLDLQRQLQQLVVATAAPQPVPWWRRAIQGDFNFDWLALRPNMVAAQGLAAVMVALASWQVFGWMSAFQPVIGDVGYAMQLVIASPAVVYLGGLQLDLQSLGIWSVVGVLGWLVSENGALGRRLASPAHRWRS